ncbi:MAG: 4Fe-4S binding protein, partial [Proteobacteria bacterium]|nr:4Fe-4S binding protein [Pseudomonadota bacterium]
DKNKCMVYAQHNACIVCEEHCPTYDKAIKFTEINLRDVAENKVVLKQPYVVEALCIGCGICEQVCPVQGRAAIRVTGKSSISTLKSGYGSS